jgi:hypothetical protein
MAFVAVKRVDPRTYSREITMRRTYDQLLNMLCVAGVPWDEAVKIARDFALSAGKEVR